MTEDPGTPKEERETVSSTVEERESVTSTARQSEKDDDEVRMQAAFEQAMKKDDNTVLTELLSQLGNTFEEEDTKKSAGEFSPAQVQQLREFSEYFYKKGKLKSFKVKDLLKIAKKYDVDLTGCLEKEELIDKVARLEV